MLGGRNGSPVVAAPVAAALLAWFCARARAMHRLLPRAFLAALLLAPGAARGQGEPADPFTWPEPQRAFLQDGPGLLLSAEQRAAFLALDETGRERFMADFLRDPLPATAENELALGIERRRRLATLETGSPQDARWQLLFLRGRPTERRVLDCAVVFRPLEIWTYRLGEEHAPHRRVLYQAATDEPFRLWMAIDAKGALYTAEMAYWLPRFQYPSRGKRFDVRFCPDAELVDQASGIEAMKPPESARAPAEGGGLGWVPPEERAARLEGPAGTAGALAQWAREAAATVLPPESPRLALSGLEVDFPGRQRQRLIARALLTLPSAEGIQLETPDLAGAAGGLPQARLLVAGRIEVAGRTFEEFRVRFQVPPPADGTPLALLLERPLRPAQSFLLRLHVRDEVGGAEATVTRGFRVPAEPVVRLAPAAVAAAAPGEPLGMGAPFGPDRLVLLPPPTEDLVLGVWRAEAVVTGDRIAKIVFLVDGESQLTRQGPPFSAEVRLARLPREQVVRIEGYDEVGALVAADEVVLNLSRGAFKVRIVEPRRGARPTGRVLARAEVVVPEERRVEAVEVRVDDELVATLEKPPWQHEIRVPPGDGIAYLSVAARLDDGSRAEDVRFLRAPADLEEVNVDLVEVYATVLDGADRPVHDLTAADFEVLEEGRRQTISQFEAVENLPLNLGIAIDTSFSMAAALTEARRAATDFLRNLLRPRDRCFALSFASRPVMLMPLVDDVEAVSRSLSGLGAFGRTALYDALLTALYTFRGQQGQSALVLLTDGEDTGSAARWEDVREYARRSGVAIFAIALGDPGRDGRAKLGELAESTGGRFFRIDRADELHGVYGEIERELRSRYLLAYAADRPAGEGGYRQVEVRLKKRGLKARTARGVYAW